MPVALTRCDAIGSAIERGTDGRAARCTIAVGVAHHLVERVGVEDGALDQRDVEVAEVVAVTGREVVERDDGLTGPAQATAEVRADEARAPVTTMLTAVKATDRPSSGRRLRAPVRHASDPPRVTPLGVPLSEHASATFLTVPRLFLSPPDVGARERARLLEAFDSNWIAPLGPDVDAFEQEFAAFVGARAAAALSSGTAALHLALVLLGVGPGDEVLVPSLTFVASANAVAYVGARPVFVDSDRATWNLDPGLVEEELAARSHAGREQPAALIGVDLYGQCADWDPILASCAAYGVPVIEDAAEALGATYRGRPAGSFGALDVFSFNGNKIITTSGGGMLDGRRPGGDRAGASPDHAGARTGAALRAHRDRVQLPDEQPAGRGRSGAARRPPGQGRDAGARSRRATARPSPASTGSGSCPTPPRASPRTGSPSSPSPIPPPSASHLESLDIEARPAWKPMHLQPLFADCERRGGAVAEEIFRTGLCLPSGSVMTDADVDRVVAGVLQVVDAA